MSDAITSSASVSAPGAKQVARRLHLASRVVAGAVLGLAWAAALRVWMVMLAVEMGERPRYTWEGTVGGILLPAAMMGALLGAATYAAQTSSRRHWRWAMLSPLLLVVGPALVTPNFVRILVTTGIGGGAVGVALMGMLGGYALSGLGSRRLRWAAGLPVAVLTLAAAYGFHLADQPSLAGAVAALLFALLMADLAAGIAAPARFAANPHPKH
jgi:hypothetical protein